MINILIVTKRELEAIKYWPLEIRAIFDPVADKELQEREREARQRQAEADKTWTEEEIPF